MTQVYIGLVLYVLALTVWLLSRSQIQSHKRFYATSPLIEVMPAACRKRHWRSGVGRVLSACLTTTAATVLLYVPGHWYIPLLGFVVALVVGRAVYQRHTRFLGMHAAFDGGKCTPIHLIIAVGMYYDDNRGTGKITLSPSYKDTDVVVLTLIERTSDGKVTYLLRPERNDPMWVMASAAMMAAAPVNFCGLLIEHLGGKPVSEIITSPIHPALPS